MVPTLLLAASLASAPALAAAPPAPAPRAERARAEGAYADAAPAEAMHTGVVHTGGTHADWTPAEGAHAEVASAEVASAEVAHLEAAPSDATHAPAPGLVAPLRLQEDWIEEQRWQEEQEEEPRRPHVLVSAWAGEAVAGGGTGRSSSFFSAEAAWVFRSVDLGVAGAWYRTLRDADTWTPVMLVRVTQRFQTRRGFEAAFSLGFGAGRPVGWVGWYQVAMGMRFPLGPLFLGGELAFEQYEIIRLGGGLGVAF